MGAILGSPSPPQASLPTAQSENATETAPQKVSNEARPRSHSPKSSTGNYKLTKTKSGEVTKTSKEMQRLPVKAIQQEFDRLLVQAQGHMTDVEERPCLEAADKMKRCLRQNRQHACRCFDTMELYRNCVMRATQDRVDDMADEEPPLLPVTPTQPMPTPTTLKTRSRRWWEFWNWFR